jgi:hypothetical protein
MPDAPTFFRDYVATRTPVVVTDLFAAEPIRAIRSKPDALEAFASTRLHVQTEYAAAAARPAEALETTMRFDEYWEHIERDRTSPLLCTEYAIPARVMQMFRLPRMCLARDLDEPEVLSMARKYGDHDLSSNVFLANRGNCAHLHFDGDHREVLLHQVFGRKQVLLFAPDACTKLRTLDGAPWSAGVYLERMSGQQKLEFLDEVGGYHTILEPGETIYMPKLIWHYLEYTEDGMSFNLRFARHRFGRFLCVDNFHRDSYVQNLGALVGGDTARASDLARAIDALSVEYLQPAGSLRDKVAGVRRVLRRACSELIPAARPDLFCPPDSEAQELDKIVQDIGQTARFMAPAHAALTRPVGPVSAVHRRQLERSADRLGYGPDLVAHLLWNLFGKHAVDEISKTEAVQFMSYMRSPGASLH